MQLLIVNAASDVKTVKDLIAKAKAQPGKLNYGAGTITTKLTGYLFNKAAGVETVLVPYNGSAEVAQGLLTKSVDFSFDGPSASLSLIQGGQFRVLAKFDPRPFPPVPDLAAHHRRGAEASTRSRSGSAWSRPRARRRPIVDKLPGGSGEDAGRSRHQGEGGRLGAVPGHQHAGGIRCLHPQGSASAGRPVVKETGMKYD